MRGMNLPDLAPVSGSLPEIVSLIAGRLDGPMPFPRLSSLLVAYIVWPESPAERDKWMVAILAQFVAASGASLSIDAGSKALEAFEAFGGLGALAEVAQDRLLDDFAGAQGRWLHVADILQTVVDMANDARLRVPGGASISKALDLTQRHNSNPSKTVFVRSWSRYRHVAHVLAAAAWLPYEAHKKRGRNEASLLAAVLLAPEAVIRLAASYQQFGLSLLSHGVHQPLLDPKHLWRVPVPSQLLPLPARRLSDSDLAYLTKERRARPK